MAGTDLCLSADLAPRLAPLGRIQSSHPATGQGGGRQLLQLIEPEPGIHRRLKVVSNSGKGRQACLPFLYFHSRQRHLFFARTSVRLERIGHVQAGLRTNRIIEYLIRCIRGRRTIGDTLLRGTHYCIRTANCDRRRRH